MVKDMGEIKLRPGITFKELGVKVERVDTYRTMNPWWQRLWKPKYNCHLIIMTKSAIYDGCSPKSKECEELLKGSK